MQRHTVRHVFFLAICIAAPAAFAGPDIVKCVDQTGHVTLTDEPCSDGRETVLVPASVNTPPAAAENQPAAPPPAMPAAARIVTTERILVPAAVMPRHDNWVGKAAPSRALARDVATLKAARASLQLMDSGRSTRLAGLN